MQRCFCCAGQHHRQSGLPPQLPRRPGPPRPCQQLRQPPLSRARGRQLPALAGALACSVRGRCENRLSFKARSAALDSRALTLGSQHATEASPLRARSEGGRPTRRNDAYSSQRTFTRFVALSGTRGRGAARSPRRPSCCKSTGETAVGTTTYFWASCEGAAGNGDVRPEPRTHGACTCRAHGAAHQQTISDVRA